MEIQDDCDNAAYALKSEAERAKRLGMLAQPHIAPLISLIDEIKIARGPDCAIPFFDPCDGGMLAKGLILLESPGNKAITSGFLSRNNRDQSANNMRDLLSKAEIDRRATLLWNIVPWYLGGPPMLHEIIEALPYLKSLIGMLTELRVVVLVGVKASELALNIAKFTSVPIIKSFYPSPRNFKTRPYLREQVQQHYIEAANLISE